VFENPMAFLSDTWFAKLGEVLDHVRVEPASSCRIQFAADDLLWHLVVVEGQVTTWGHGELPSAGVTLHWSTAHADQIWSGELTGNDALAVTTVVTAGPGDVYDGPPAPLDISRHWRLAALSPQAGATVTVQFILRRGPFGDVTYVIEFTDGQVREERLGTVHDPDVSIQTSFRNYGLLRGGQIGIIDALQGGTIDGQLGPITTLAGLLESPEIGQNDDVPVDDILALATLGELWADPEVSSSRTSAAADRTP
jgi:hypothetical protein